MDAHEIFLNIVLWFGIWKRQRLRIWSGILKGSVDVSMYLCLPQMLNIYFINSGIAYTVHYIPISDVHPTILIFI